MGFDRLSLRFLPLFRFILLTLFILSFASATPFFSSDGTVSNVKRQFATFGPHLSLGQTDSEYIKMTTTFAPGNPPAQMTGSLFIWPGLFDEKNRTEGDLVQTVVEYHEPRAMQQTCNPYPGQWCIRPFVVSKAYISQTPAFGKAIDGKDHIKIEYTKPADNNGLWNQTIWNLSKRNTQLFTYLKGSAKCKWFEIATESQGGNKGSADTQFYYNTTLILKDPDPKLVDRFHTTGNIVATKPTTPDGGKTWLIEKVEIPPMLPGTAYKPGWL